MDGLDNFPVVADPQPLWQRAVVRPLLRVCVPPRSVSERAAAMTAACFDPRREQRRLLLRWLRALGVVAVVLAFAIAAVAAPTADDQVIVPNSESAKPASPGAAPGNGMFTAVAVLLLAGAGAWLVWRGRQGKLTNLNRQGRKLEIEETRPLGNRQYLVVATYQDKKFLLGVCPGRIDLLAPLHDGGAANPTKERT